MFNNTIGCLPTRNYNEGQFEFADDISGEHMSETILKERDTCYACVVRCKRVVEIKEGDKPPRTRLSCAMKVKEGLEVTTESAMIHQMRNTAIGNLLKQAPHAEAIHKIGLEFGLTTGAIPDGCIRCRLCVRVCSEIIGAKALTFVREGGRSYVAPSEKGSCIGCLTCTNLCPTGAIHFEDKENVRTILIRPISPVPFSTRTRWWAS